MDYRNNSLPTKQVDPDCTPIPVPPSAPIDSKGKIRAELERRMAQASEAGVRSLVLRAGDFFGPRPGQSWFSQGMVKPGQAVRAITCPGPHGVGHSWAYLPDVAQTFARLVAREQDLPAFARIHFGGIWDADGSALPEAIRRLVARPALKVKRLPWTAMSLMAPFNETMREMMEIKPLWQAPVRLDNNQLLTFLEDEPHTPLDQAMHATLHALGCLRKAQPSGPADRAS
jgi:nucleoside-diphosphate-sugar epimerase